MDKILLTRDEFQKRVFARDNHKCVICGEPAVDAHHIMERRLWNDGGYYLDNGVSVCEDHHLLAEATVITPQELRDAAGIESVHLPRCLYNGEYDKWGNLYLENGKRMRGELFYDESVQKLLDPDDFVKYVKYPRTPHLPNSPGIYAPHNDDVVNWEYDEKMEGVEVVVTEKMDGENTTMYNDYIHARSLESGYHIARTWVKNLQGRIGYEIPESFRICGENLYAKHSVGYDNLASYFLVFGIWDGGVCLSWDDTEAYSDMLGLNLVPVLYRGPYYEHLWYDVTIKLSLEDKKQDKCEGFVVRPTDSFLLSQFRQKVAKYVRADHGQTHGVHWHHSQIETNKVVS